MPTDEALDAALDRIEERKRARAREKAIRDRGLVKDRRLLKFVGPTPRIYSGCATDLSVDPVEIPKAEGLPGVLLWPGAFLNLNEGDDARRLPYPHEVNGRPFEWFVDATSEEAGSAVSVEMASRFLSLQALVLNAEKLVEAMERELARRKSAREEVERELERAKAHEADGRAMKTSAVRNRDAESARFDSRVAELGRPLESLRAAAAQMLRVPASKAEVDTRYWSPQEALPLARRFAESEQAEDRAAAAPRPSPPAQRGGATTRVRVVGAVVDLDQGKGYQKLERGQVLDLPAGLAREGVAKGAFEVIA